MHRHADSIHDRRAHRDRTAAHDRQTERALRPARPAGIANALQHTAGNRAAARVLARSVKMSGNGQLVKGERLDFESDLKANMLLGDGQHRAHVIAYDTIVRGVMDPINRCIRDRKLDWLNATYNMIPAVFPCGEQSLRHPSLSNLSQLYHRRAVSAYKEIDASLKGAPSPPLAVAVNHLIGALNNSPDNLRPGADKTNSSIKEGLDLEPRAKPYDVQALGAGTQYVNKLLPNEGLTTAGLPKEILVLRVKKLDEEMVWKMLTTTWSLSNELHLYSSGVKLQSSNYVGMTSGSMSTQNPTHVAIEVPDHPDVFYLFKFFGS